MFAWFGMAMGWLRANPVVSRILMWGAIALAAFAGIQKWKSDIQAGVRRQEREQKEREALRTQAAVKDQRVETTKQEATYANEALEARDTGPVYADADSVPDKVAGVLFR